MGIPSMLINPLILISSFFLSGMILILYIKYYQPYFFPEKELDGSNIDQIIKNNDTYDQELLLIKGAVSMETSLPIIYNTSIRSDSKYVNFAPSINKMGGNQFTYSFWFNKKNNTYIDKEILNKVGSFKIKFGSDSRKLNIDFKTNNGLQEVVIDKKLFDITSHDTWFMLSVVIKDYIDYKKNNHPNGVELSVYLNDTLLDIKILEGEMLKIPDGSQFKILGENSKDTSGNVYNNLPGEIADIRYYNYALSHQDIIKLHKKKFNNIVYQTIHQLDSNRNKQDLHHINLVNQIASY